VQAARQTVWQGQWIFLAMKPVVLFLALLAAAKLGHQEYLFRTGTRDAILGAYREHATEACQHQARGLAPGMPAQAWASPASIQLVIGDNSLDVNLWQVDNALWSARYRNPYLLLTAGQHSGTIWCEYDILNAAASVHRP
jgi:hypothetical protein